MKLIKIIFITILFFSFNSLFSQEIKRLYKGNNGEIKSERIYVNPSPTNKSKEIKNKCIEIVSAIELNNTELNKIKTASIPYDEKVKKLRQIENEIKKYKTEYCQFYRSNKIVDKEATKLYQQYSKDI